MVGEGAGSDRIVRADPNLRPDPPTPNKHNPPNKTNDKQARLREAAMYEDWERKEEEFHLEQVQIYIYMDIFWCHGWFGVCVICMHVIGRTRPRPTHPHLTTNNHPNTHKTKTQARIRSKIRLIEGREKPIDALAKNLLLFGQGAEDDAGEEGRGGIIKYRCVRYVGVWGVGSVRCVVSIQNQPRAHGPSTRPVGGRPAL